MSVASELAVRFTADTSGLEAGGTKATGVIGSIADKLGKLGLAGMGVGIVKDAVGAIAGSIGGLVEAAEAAGDAKARLDIVLGSDLSAVVEDNASIANSLGMTKTAYLEAAGAASNYLVNLGLSKDAAGEMAVGLTDLAPKLAAFTGADPSAVTDALQKGVGGATRGLKELGIAIDTEAISKLPKAAQAAAIYEQILAQSGGAQQAWADNQGDVANSMARVSAAMDDARAAIGERLLPIIAPLAEWFANKLPGAIDTAAAVFGPLLDTLSEMGTLIGDTITPVIDAMTAGWADCGGGFDSVSSLVDGLIGALGGLLESMGFSEGALDSLFKTVRDVRDGFEVFRAKVVEVFGQVREAVGRVVDWFNSNVKPILIGVFATIRDKVIELKSQFDTHFGGIRGAVQAVVDWLKANVVPTFETIFDRVMSVVGPVVAFLKAHMDEIKLAVSGAFDLVVGVVTGAFTIIKGLFETGLAIIRGDWSGAWEAIKGTVSGVVPAVQRILDGLWSFLRGLGGMALDAALGVGAAIVDGLRNGIQSKWDAVLSWIRTQIEKIPLAVRQVLGIASPSKVMKGIGRDVVEGLIVGLAERAANVTEAMTAIAAGLIEAARGALDSHSPSRAFAAIGGDVVVGLGEGLGRVSEATAPLVDGIRSGMADAAGAAEQEAGRFADIGAAIDFSPIQQSIDDLRVALVDTLAPAAEETASKLDTLGSASTVVDMLNNVTRGGAGVAPMLAGIGGAALTTSGASGLGALVAALAGPVALAIGGAIAIGATLYAAWSSNFGGIRDKTLEVVAVVQAKWAELRAKLASVFGEIWQSLQPLRDRFIAAWQAINDKVSAVVAWIADNAGAILSRVFDGIGGALDALAAFWRTNGADIVAIVSGVWDTVAGLVNAAMALIGGLVRTAMAIIRGDWSGAWEAIKQTAANVVPGIRQALSGLWETLKGLGGMALDAALGIGTAIVDGIKRGIGNAWDSVTSWVNTQINKLPAGVRKILGIASPSRVFVEIGEQVVAGLRIGLEGIAIIGAIIQDGLAKSIGAMDVENFEMIHRLTSAILGIFKDAAEGIRSLLEFDIVTTADEIAAAFNRLVGVFEVALGRMAELSKFAGRGTQPGQEGFINLDHINNIERYTAAIEQTIGVASGTLDILEKLSTLTLPGAGAITALIPFLQEVANAAAVFEQPLGKDEDAIAVFERGAIVAGHMANFAKSVAELAALKFGQISTAFASEVNAAAAAASQAWAAVSEAARLWGDMESMTRDKLVVGVKAYAEAVGAAVSILKGAAELDFEDVTFATATQLAAAAQSAADALVSIMAAAKWWIDAPKEAAKVVEGVKAYAEAAGAAVGLLRSAGDLDFSEAVAVTSTDLGRAADNAKRALEELGEAKDWFIKWPEEAAKVVTGIKAYADAAGAAVGLLGSAGALDFSKAVAVTSTDLGRAADVAEMAYEELRRIAAGFIDMGEEMTGPIVAGIKAFADAAGAALDLLAKGASGMNALGEIKKLAGVQPRLIRQIMAQLAYIVNAVAAEVPTVPEETVTRLKGLADLAGVFDPLAKAAEGMNALGEVKRLAGVQPRLIRAILAGVNAAVTEVATGAGSFGTEAIAKVKAWGEASAVTLGALTTAADGLNKMSAKLTIPDDLSARVAALVTAMRIVVDSMADALDAGAIRLDVAKAGADVAAAVGAIADAMGPVFDAINAAISSPFGRIRATGQRGDTFRQNIANRIRASIVAAVTAISDALKELPTINVPDELVTQVDKLASVYERILDVVERLGEVKVDTRSIAALSAAMATLAGGVAAGAPGGAIAVTSGGSGTTLTVSSGPGGGIEITNVYSPTVTPMPVTINTTNNINIGQRTIETIATEVKILQELELRQGQTT